MKTKAIEDKTAREYATLKEVRELGSLSNRDFHAKMKSLHDEKIQEYFNAVHVKAPANLRCVAQRLWENRG